jgi:uncharacterized membrane protein YbhN (UPF0104 family)
MLAGVFSTLVSGVIYITQGMQTLHKEVLLALVEVFTFWFALFWNLAFLIALFRSLKFIFNSCYATHKLELYTCQKEQVFEVGYGDLVKLWRRWIMTMIWLVGAQMIIALILTKLFSSYEDVFEWFSIYILYLFVMVAGFVSFTLLSSRCKQVRVRKC